MEMFMYLFVFLAFFHIISNHDVREMEKVPDNVELGISRWENSGNYLNFDIKCKRGFKLVGATNITLKVVSQKWMYIGKKPRCILLEVDVDCPYPPRLVDNLTVKECIETNGKKSNCTLSCENENYQYMNGDNEMFCNFRTGKWVQEKSTHIATTCQQEFDCKFCDNLRCPSATNKKCKKLTKKCSCSCPHWDSCKEFKCPKDYPESFCKGITSKPGDCSCR